MIKTSVSLPDDVADELSRKAPDFPGRSKLVTKALRAYFKGGRKGSEDLAIIDAHAKELNAEAQEVLEFQQLS